MISSIVLGCWIWEDGNYWMLLFLIHPYLLQFLTFLIQSLNQIKIVLSVIVNYSLYYFFKIFGRDFRRRPLLKKMINLNVILSVIVLLFSACERKVQPSLDSKFIISQLSVHKYQKTDFVRSIDSVEFNFLEDTLINNVAIESKELNNMLAYELLRFDSLPANNSSKLYLKALFLADFTYSAFSYQFVGRELGLANDSAMFHNWENLSIAQQFNFGNKNLVSASCGVRTYLYKQLVKEHLKLPVRDTSIEGIHTYPIVTIAEREYLFDPSEPMIFCAEKGRKILEYTQLRNREDVMIFKSPRSFGPTPRSFGPTHFLFSDKFLLEINPFGESLKKQIAQYLIRNRKLLLEKVPKSFVANFQKKWNVSYTKSKNNKLAIALETRNVGMLLTPQNMKETYFGTGCKILN
ncbi:MAG: hypothetical protein ACJARP_002426 [Vicingaceae bacterium]